MERIKQKITKVVFLLHSADDILIFILFSEKIRHFM